MRIRIELVGQDYIVLKAGFNRALQGLIYSMIRDEWLHEVGYTYGKRSFRLFVYSSILEKGKYKKETKTFIFPKNVSFLVASPLNWILEKLAYGIISSNKLRLDNNIVDVISISVLKQQSINSEKILVKTITPIEVHSTFEKKGVKKTLYYSAYDPEFAEMINANMKKKWEAFFKKPCPYNIYIKPAGKNKERIVRFGTNERYVIVKGWSGFFELTGHPEFLSFALDAGLGSRNAQGFGMVEVVREKKREQKRSVKGAYSE